MAAFKKTKETNRKPRCNDVERDHRVNAIYKLLSEGQSRQQIIQFVADRWDLSERQTDNYIKSAREKLMADCEMERPAWISEALQRLRVVEQKAMAKNQPAAAINAIKLQAELIGIQL